VANLNEIRVRLGLDKTGFDSGLKGAGATVKKFLSFFGIATSAVFLKRIIGDVGALASEVATLRNESLIARDAFDRMASGVEHVGNVAGLTTEQLEKMRKAAKMFTPEELDQLKRGADLWTKIKDGTSTAIGKVAAFAVGAGSAFFKIGSGLLAGTAEDEGRIVASDREVAKALRDERQRLKLIEDQNAELESRRALFSEEDVYIQKMVEAEQTRLDIERERVRLKIIELETDRKSAEQRLRDRSGFTLAELAGLTSGGPGALKANQAALKIEQLEEKARQARLEEFGAAPMTERQKMEAARRAARGIAGPLSADELTAQALQLRGELEPLVSGERNPMGELEAIKTELATLRELATGAGLQVQPRMAK
jgi:hypothetical protein